MNSVAVGMSWVDRWASFRDSLLASRRFQRWAAEFPLTRPIARRRASAVFDLCAGFVYSQILLACVRLRLFDILAEGPLSEKALAAQLGLSADACSRLLDAAIALRLVARRRGDRYGLGVLGAPMVGNGAITAMVEHHTMLYADLRDPVALLRGQQQDTALSAYWPYARDSSPEAISPERIAAYTTLMSASQPLVTEEIIDAYPLGQHRCLLDVGGGDGTFLAAVGTRYPNLKLILFDLPAVADRGRARFAAEGFGKRASAVGGSFLTDSLPDGADIISLVRVIHDHDDVRALAILRRAHAALPKNGTLLLAEPMSATPGADAIGDAYFGFYLLAMGRGRARTPKQLGEMMQAAGFAAPTRVPTRIPLQTSILIAHPSKAS
jgi:demethylspheroidene O-methyltransferase